MFRLLIIVLSLTTSLALSSLTQAAEKSSDSSVQIATLMVNLNTATAEEIADVLTGVGLKKATVIVAHRDENGPFKSIDQILDVKGIGPSTLKKNRHKIEL